jgi:hypothetical protein
VRRIIVIAGAALLLLLTVAPALAQDTPTQKEPSRPEPLLAGIVQITDVVLSVDGKRVDAAPPGVPVVAALGVQNGGADRITNVRITVAPPAEDEARLTRSESPVGDLDPGEVGRAEIALVVRPERCNEFIGLGGDATFDGGSSPIKIAVPVACPGPRLWLENVEFEGGDGDGVPEPGETLRMFATVRNDGRDPATGVRARVTMRGDGITATGTNLAWNDIAPGRSQRSITAVLVGLAKDAPRQEPCDGLPRGEPVPDKSGAESLPPDSPVSSDGSVSPPSSGSGDGQSVPGSTGGGEPGSTGSGGTVIADPAPGTGTIEPLPAPAPDEPGTDGREPAPAPIEPAPNPEPARDLPARIDVQFDVQAREYTISLEYSTAIVCALREGGAVDDLGPTLAARGESGTATGGIAVPLALALLVSMAAVGTRAALIH